MIVSFKHKKFEQIFRGEVVKGFAVTIQVRAKDKMDEVHNAMRVEDLRIPPSNHLEKLKGDRKEQYSIRINKQWRLCFRFENGNAYDVEMVDYH
jgi:proteic killer suppression protein